MRAMLCAAKFSVGQIIHHRLFDYRGAIVSVDPVFSGSDEWYDKVARTRPPKDAPWYHVLVHDSELITYVAERNIESDATGDPIEHPLIGTLLGEYEGGRYADPSAVH